MVDAADKPIEEVKTCGTCMGNQVFKGSANGPIKADCSKCGGNPSKDKEQLKA